jgi:hypothetical protein
MAFWIAILGGTLFVWLAVHLGLYETWALLFNVVVSVYVAVFLAPSLAPLTPASPYRMALSLLVIGGGLFALLQGLSFVFLTGQFSVRFSRLFDVVAAGVLGFATGFLIFSFLGLAFATTPLAQRGFVGRIGFNPEAQELNLAGVAWSCQRVHMLTGSEGTDNAAQTAVERILQEADELAPADANEPNLEDLQSQALPVSTPQTAP